MEDVMKNVLSVAATAALVAGGAGAAAAELPVFERMGFPITAHQVSVVGGAHVQERSSSPALTLAGMPASPHQVAVLTPRPRIPQQQIAENLIKAGFSQVRFVVPPEYVVIALRNREWTHLMIDSRTGKPR
jgi:hypothetical protein